MIEIGVAENIEIVATKTVHVLERPASGVLTTIYVDLAVFSVVFAVTVHVAAVGSTFPVVAVITVPVVVVSIIAPVAA